MRRRQLLSYGAISLLTPWPNLLRASEGASPWLAPATSQSGQFKLAPQASQWQLAPELPSTDIWTYAENSFSPVISVQQGDTLDVQVTNKLMESTSVHWHGIRVPNNMDGVPGISQPPIAPGESFNYQFKVDDAGTYWFHPHINSTEQLGRGLVGALVVQESSYPVDRDEVILLNDWLVDEELNIIDQFSSPRDMSHDGRFGNVITVNGKYRPTFHLRPNERVRFRFINGATARIFRPSLPQQVKAYIIAIDGHPIEPKPYTGQLLAPGMRCDIVVDAGSTASETVMGDTAYEPTGICRWLVSGQAVRSAPLTNPPPRLSDNPIAKPDLNRAIDLELRLDGGAMTMAMMKGMQSGQYWYLNDQQIDQDTLLNKPLMSLQLHQSYRMKIVNNTRFAHPMHLHGHTFQILQDIPYWTDTALVMPGQTTEIAFVADNPGIWMLHCHVLGHQASGMMASIEVV